jgi:hypothetical protein
VEGRFEGGRNAPTVVATVGVGVVAGSVCAGAGVVPWPLSGNCCHSSSGGCDGSAANASPAAPPSPMTIEHQSRALAYPRERDVVP